MSNTDYRLVTDIQGIRAYIGDSKVVAFDFETAPVEPYREDEKAALDPWRSRIVGCSFSVTEHTGIYVPVAHVTGPNISGKAFFRFLEEFLTSGSTLKIAHNIAFESQMAYHLGIVIQQPVYDTADRMVQTVFRTSSAAIVGVSSPLRSKPKRQAVQTAGCGHPSDWPRRRACPRRPLRGRR